MFLGWFKEREACIVVEIVSKKDGELMISMVDFHGTQGKGGLLDAIYPKSIRSRRGLLINNNIPIQHPYMDFIKKRSLERRFMRRHEEEIWYRRRANYTRPDLEIIYFEIGLRGPMN